MSELQTVSFDPATHKLMPLTMTEEMLTAKPKSVGMQGQCVSSMQRNADIAKYEAWIKAASVTPAQPSTGLIVTRYGFDCDEFGPMEDGPYVLYDDVKTLGPV